MPLEFRKIMFSESEVRMALTHYCERHHFDGKQIMVNDFKQAWGDTGFTATLACQESEGGNKRKIRLGSTEVAAALISYCHENGAKIPHYAEKALEQTEKGVALMLHHDWQDHFGSPPPGI